EKRSVQIDAEDPYVRACELGPPLMQQDRERVRFLAGAAACTQYSQLLHALAPHTDQLGNDFVDEGSECGGLAEKIGLANGKLGRERLREWFGERRGNQPLDAGSHIGEIERFAERDNAALKLIAPLCREAEAEAFANEIAQLRPVRALNVLET